MPDERIPVPITPRPHAVMTPAEEAILAALRRYTLRSDLQLAAATGLGISRVYPALMALEQAGVIVSEWEDMPPPRRRRYRIAS